MFALLVSIITLLSATSTFAMHPIKTSRLLQQRAYTTMTKKDFARLTGLQKNNYPLRPRIFASELTAMEKDDEDLKNLQQHLTLQMNLVKKESNEYTNNMPQLLIGMISTPIGLAFFADPQLPVVGIPIVIWGVYKIWKSFPRVTENYSKDKAFWMHRENLYHVDSLIEQNEHIQKCSRVEAMLEKIKSRYNE